MRNKVFQTRSAGGTSVWTGYMPEGVPMAQMILDFRRGIYLSADSPITAPVPRTLAAIQTFVRSGAATEFDASGALVTYPADTPRIAHDPATGQRLGLRVEGSVANLVLQSGSLSLSPWFGSNVTVADNAAIGIDGQMSACVLTELTNTAGREREQAISGLVAGTRYTAWTIVRRGAGNRHPFIVLTSSTVFGPGSPRAILNADTGVVTGGGGTNQAVGAFQLLSGDWLIWMACDAIASGASGLRVGFSDSPTNAFSSYLGDGVSGMVISHVQMEVGQRTSPIVTGASAVTRASDRPTISLGPWWNASGGTMWMTVRQMPADATIRRLGGVGAAALDASALNVFRAADNSLALLGGPGANVVATMLSAGGYTGQDLTAAFAWAAPNGTVRASLNGGSVVSDTATALTAGQTQMRAGLEPWGGGASQIDGIVARVGYHATPLTDAQLQAISGMP